MHFRLDKDVFLHAIFPGYTMTEKKMDHPIAMVRNVLLTVEDGQLTCIGTDMDKTAIVKVEAHEGVNGSIAVPAKLLYETVRKANAANLVCTGDMGNQTLTIDYGQSQAKLFGLPGREYPMIMSEEIAEPVYTTISSDLLLMGLNQTMYSVSPEDSNPALNVLTIEFGRSETLFYALCEYGIAFSKLPIQSDLGRAGLKFSVLADFRKLLEARKIYQMAIAQDHLFIKTDTTLITIRLVDTLRLHWESKFEKTGPYIAIKKTPLLEALRRGHDYVVGVDDEVELSIKGKVLRLLAQDPKQGKFLENIHLDKDYGTKSVHTNGKQLQKALEVQVDEDLFLELRTTSIILLSKEHNQGGYVANIAGPKNDA